MKDFFKYTFFLQFIFILILTKVYAQSSVCLYEDSNNNYAIIYQGEEFNSVNGSQNNLAIEYHHGRDIYYSGKYLYKDEIKSSTPQISINLNKDTFNTYNLGVFLVDTTINDAYKKYNAYIYDTEGTRKTINMSLMQENVTFYDLSLSGGYNDSCISFDLNDDDSMSNAYAKANGTKLQNLFKKRNNQTYDPTVYNPEIEDCKKTGDCCSSFLGSPDPKLNGQNDPAYYLTFAFKVIRYIAIIILIVLSTMDFLSAVASHDDDELKKAMNKTIIRIVLCIVIFLLPTLIAFILRLINNKAIDLCINTQ